jgi:HAD superfamily hydrolase (TIGR01509 family)
MPQGLSLARFDAVLFDVDGTLVDSLEMIIPGLGDAIERYAGIRPPDSEIQALIGVPIRAQLERYLTYSPTDEQLREMTDYTLARYDAYLDGEKLIDPAIATLRLCKAMGLRTALVTSKNTKELTDFLRRFPAADAVDATVCASDVSNPKPAPDSAFLALSQLEVSPERAVFVGDSIYDMRCARAANVAQIAVGYGSATTEALLAENPDLYFNSPDDLYAWARQTILNRNAPQESNSQRFIDPNDPDSRAEGAA